MGKWDMEWWELPPPFWDSIEPYLEKKMKTVFSEFLNETGEWHALWFGFYSTFFKLKLERLSEELKKDIKREYHYYLIGYFLARIVQALLVGTGLAFWL